MRTAFLTTDDKLIGLIQVENQEVVMLYFDGEAIDDNLGKGIHMELNEVTKDGASREEHLQFGAKVAVKFGLERAKPWAFDTVGLYDFIENS
jgi:hypothetical protein